MFAAFMGYNPIAELLGASGVLQQPGVNPAVLTGKQFFPALDLGAVPQRVSRGVHRRRGDDGHRRGSLLVNPGRTVDDGDN